MRATGSDKALRIGEWHLIPTQNLLRRAGQEIRLEPRHVDLLVFLAEHRGEVLGADEILAKVWGGAVVGDHSVYQAVAKLRKALGDDASRSRYIETVPKRGYRLVAEVATPADPPSESAPSRAGMEDGRSGLAEGHWAKPLESIRWGLVALALVAAALALVWRFAQHPGERPGSAHRRLVVLPFSSLSAVESDRLVAEGFAIELANLLGNSEDLQVVGPVSTKLAVQTGAGTGEIGERLDADIVVSGSLRRAASQLRISAALTDARSGVQLWSGVFDRGDGDVLQIQRSVATEIAEALEERLGVGFRASMGARLTGKSKAYDDFLLGEYYRSIRSAASLERARTVFQRALDIDPGFTAAKRNLAATYLLLSFYGNLPLREALDSARPLLKQCLKESADDPALLGIVGLSHYLEGAYGLAEEYLRRAVARAPSYVEGWMWLGLSERQQGRLRDALSAFEHARGLEPLMVTAVVNNANALIWSGHPREARVLLEDLATTVRDRPQLERILSNIALESGDLTGAYGWAQKALAIEPDDPLSKINMAMVLAYLGQEEEALSMVAGLGGALQQGRAGQLYLDRMTLTAPRLLPPDIDRLYDARLTSTPSLPEIDWRLANARIGLADYFSGKLDTARDRLGRSLAGRIYPIQRTDYDLFLCTSLADIEGRLGDERAASRSLARCKDDRTEARRHGWSSLALIYVEARLAMMRGARSDALRALEEVHAQGFRNAKLLGTDPVFEPIRNEPAFRDLHASMQRSVEQAWTAIASGGDCSGPSGCAPSASGNMGSPSEASQ